MYWVQIESWKIFKEEYKLHDLEQYLKDAFKQRICQL